jgi:hypothetical protein
LTAWSFIFETPVEKVEEHAKLLGSVGVSLLMLPNLDATRYVCAPAFGTSEFASSVDGPVWVFGTPLFYEYIVGYDRSTSPPEISFSTEVCGMCSGAGTTPLSLAMEGEKRQRRSAETSRHPRMIHGPLRVGSKTANLRM